LLLDVADALLEGVGVGDQGADVGRGRLAVAHGVLLVCGVMASWRRGVMTSWCGCVDWSEGRDGVVRGGEALGEQGRGGCRERGGVLPGGDGAGDLAVGRPRAGARSAGVEG